MVLHPGTEERLLAGGAAHEDKEKTAFSMCQGIWKFTIMTFSI
jgi:hypothetical protein